MDDEINVDIPSSIENLEFGATESGSEVQQPTQGVAETQEESTQDETVSESSENDSQNNEGQEQAVAEDGDDTATATDESVREHNRIYAERRIAARQQQEQANQEFVESLRQKVYDQLANTIDEDKYQDLASTDGQAVADAQRRLDELEIREKQREFDEGLRRVEHFQSQLGMEIAQAQNTIDIFNPSNKEAYRESLLNDAQRSYVREHAILEQDQNGNLIILGAKEGSPSMYEYLNEKAGFYRDILKSEALRGQQAAQRTAGRADFRSKETNTSKSSNSLQALEDRIGDIPLA